MSGREMRETAVEWIGQVPSEWEVVLVRRAAQLESGHTPSRSNGGYWIPSECVIPWFTLGDIWQLRRGSQKYVRETAERISPTGMANSSARLLPTGTVILSRTASVGFSGILAVPMATTQDFANWICGARLLPDYLLWALRAMKPDFERLMMGSTHQTIYMPDIRQIKIPLPPLDVQRAIADFLDRKTAAIDDLIEQKQRLLGLLAEKRAALINRAVTRGLDPDVPLKDSGIPWIGEIPAHWEVQRLGHLSRLVQTGPFGSQLHAESYIDGGVPLVNPSNISDGRISPDQRKTVTVDTANRLSRHRLQLGDIAFARRGELGRCAVVTDTEAGWLCGTGSLLVRLDTVRVRPEWLWSLSRCRWFGQWLSLQSVGSTMDNLNTEILSGLPVLVPPIDEQKAILLDVAQHTEMLDDSAQGLQAAIDSLQEYRQSLITAAVTGQIDVG